jgi:hypothetical protein
MIASVQKSASFFFVVAGIAAAAVCGCSRSKGPERHSIRGSVTFKGEPVPLGQIAFEPDASQGNEGPGGYADIIAGRYTTHMGAVSGPHRVRISGQSGPVVDETKDVTLFSDYVTSVMIDPEFPEIDFDIPEQSVRRARRR